MRFEDRVATVDIATRFQEGNNKVFKIVDEEINNGKTQALCGEKKAYTLGH